MRITLTIVAMAATMATAATAATTMHHRHMAKTDSSSAAVRELNQKSLQQASAGGTMTPPMVGQSAAPMSDAGTPAPGMSSMPMSAPNATPDAPAPDASAPAPTATTPPQ